MVFTAWYSILPVSYSVLGTNTPQKETRSITPFWPAASLVPKRAEVCGSLDYGFTFGAYGPCLELPCDNSRAILSQGLVSGPMTKPVSQ